MTDDGGHAIWRLRRTRMQVNRMEKKVRVRERAQEFRGLAELARKKREAAGGKTPKETG